MKKKYTIILIVVSVILILALAIGLSVGLRKNDKNKVASASAEADGGGDEEGGGGPPGPMDAQCTSSSTRFCVTVVDSKFHIDGAAPSDGAITITRGETYTFDQSDSSNSGQPNLDILDLTSLPSPSVGFAPYNTNGECSSCVTFNGTPGQSGASTVFAVPSNNSVSLAYGSGPTTMGATFLIDDASATIPS